MNGAAGSPQIVVWIGAVAALLAAGGGVAAIVKAFAERQSAKMTALSTLQGVWHAELEEVRETVEALRADAARAVAAAEERERSFALRAAELQRDAERWRAEALQLREEVASLTAELRLWREGRASFPPPPAAP